MKKLFSFVMTSVVLFSLIAVFTVGAQATDINVTVAVGEEIYYVLEDASGYNGTIKNVNFVSGYLPSGVSLWGNGGNTLYISGSPAYTGSWDFYTTYDIIAGMGAEAKSSHIIINVVEAASSGTAGSSGTAASPTSPPTVTKNPGSESIDEGDGCAFTAYADNYDSNVWMFESPNGNYYTPAQVMEMYPTLTVSGTYTSRLNLSDVPADMDGWEVYCVFYNDAGKSFTANASLSVASAPEATPEPEKTPRPTATPAPTLPPVVDSEDAPESTVISTKWSSDNDFHWHTGTDMVRYDIAQHDVSEWIKSNEGDMVGICNVCGMSVHKANEGLSTLSLILIIAAALILITMLVLLIAGNKRSSRAEHSYEDENHYHGHHISDD